LDAPRPLYFDWAATAPLSDVARAALVAHLGPELGNASSLHEPGRRARAALTAARRAVAAALGVGRDDIVFTGNGSEANLLAVVGAGRALPRERRHVLVSPVEHPSVLEPLEALAKSGEIELEKLPVDGAGRVDPADVAARLRPTTGLVTVMLANHELGTIEPVEEIAKLARGRGALVHSDGAQAVGKIPVRLHSLGVDVFTASAHKFGGPRGVGILARRPGVRLASPLSGGRQEHGLRGGTEDVAGCTAAAAALSAAVAGQPALAARLAELTALLRGELQRALPDLSFHSPLQGAVPGLVNVSLPDLEGPLVVAALDQRKVAVSHGAACSSLAALPSHVLVAAGAAARARHSVRLSMGRTTTRADVLDLVARLVDAVAAMRDAATFSSSQNRGNSR
jgi:cysteine desulfurase